MPDEVNLVYYIIHHYYCVVMYSFVPAILQAQSILFSYGTTFNGKYSGKR